MTPRFTNGEGFIYALIVFAGLCGFLGGLVGIAALAVWARWTN